MSVLYLLYTGSNKKIGLVPSHKQARKYYLLQILQQADDIDKLKKLVNLED